MNESFISCKKCWFLQAFSGTLIGCMSCIVAVAKDLSLNLELFYSTYKCHTYLAREREQLNFSRI